MQHRLRSLLSVSGAGFVRYVYGAPLSLAAVGVIAWPSTVLGSPQSPGPVLADHRRWAGWRRSSGRSAMIRAFDARDFADRHGVREDRGRAGGGVLARVPRRTAATARVGGHRACASPVSSSLAGGRRRVAGADRAVLFGLVRRRRVRLASVGIRAASQSLLDGYHDGGDHVVPRHSSRSR
jgi:hypothetical protein